MHPHKLTCLPARLWPRFLQQDESNAICLGGLLVLVFTVTCTIPCFRAGLRLLLLYARVYVLDLASLTPGGPPRRLLKGMQTSASFPRTTTTAHVYVYSIAITVGVGPDSGPRTLRQYELTVPIP